MSDVFLLWSNKYSCSALGTMAIKNLEGENLPPTLPALLPHLMRANFMAMRDTSYTLNCPIVPPLEENGWTVIESGYIHVRCICLPAPKAVIELIKCACKSDCRGHIFGCRTKFLAVLCVSATRTSVKTRARLNLYFRMMTVKL